MRIVADENIPYAQEAFSAFGEVRLLSGREITAHQLRDADALLVRSITPVNQALLEGTRIRFVGTATIGTDHVDEAYLSAQHLAFAFAPGCNANSVGEYIAAALLVVAERHGLTLGGSSLGIIGHGNAGKATEAKARALGMQVVLHDPPRAEQTGDNRYESLDAVLACDFISLHVPLTRNGPHPTYHLVDESFLQAMAPHAFLLNSARGPVVDNLALLLSLQQRQIAGAVLDVWEGEPGFSPPLAQRVDVATPHIAGYSFDGKVAGTRQIYEAFCACFGVDTPWPVEPLLPTPSVPTLTLPPLGNATISSAVWAVYDILTDDAALRQLLPLGERERAAGFDRLRKEYPQRREFRHTRITLDPADAALENQLRALGFTIA